MVGARINTLQQYVRYSDRPRRRTMASKFKSKIYASNFNHAHTVTWSARVWTPLYNMSDISDGAAARVAGLWHLNLRVKYILVSLIICILSAVSTHVITFQQYITYSRRTRHPCRRTIAFKIENKIYISLLNYAHISIQLVRV